MDAEAALPAPVESSEVVPVSRPAPGMDISAYAPGLVVLETATWYATELRRLPRLPADEERAHALAVVASAADLRQAAVQLDAIQAAALGAFEPFIHEGRPPRRCLIVEEHLPEPLGRRLRDLHAQVGCRRRPAALAPDDGRRAGPRVRGVAIQPSVAAGARSRAPPLRHAGRPERADRCGALHPRPGRPGPREPPPGARSGPAGAGPSRSAGGSHPGGEPRPPARGRALRPVAWRTLLELRRAGAHARHPRPGAPDAGGAADDPGDPHGDGLDPPAARTVPDTKRR